MSDELFALVSVYGVWVIGASAFLSCLMLPVPTSFLMLAGGAFVASGDLVAWQVFAVAYGAALLGDQAGFRLGRSGSGVLERLGRDSRRRAAVIARARALVERRGGPGVFFSTWLVAPLGPYVNVIAGATGMSWLRFTFWDALGELVWVTGYLALGYAFAAQIDTLSGVLSNSVGFLVAATLTALLALAMRDALRRARAGR
jgi:membrane protein DedA with SNARE-associated domain